MLFNIYDENKKLIAQVEGNTRSEAREYAYKMYGSQHFPRRALDLRPVEEKRAEEVSQSLGKFELYNTQYSLKQLQEIAKNAGINPSGLKEDLINRLAQKGMLK